MTCESKETAAKRLCAEPAFKKLVEEMNAWAGAYGDDIEDARATPVEVVLAVCAAAAGHLGYETVLPVKMYGGYREIELLATWFTALNELVDVYGGAVIRGLLAVMEGKKRVWQR